MPNKKDDSEFVVTDRRKFTPEGELRQEEGDALEKDQAKSQEASRQPEQKQANATPTPSAAAPAPPEEPSAPPPTAAEQQEQKSAYQESSRKMDADLQRELGHSAKDFEMNFERFIASLYMTALLQLGLMHEKDEQPPPADLMGARQTIDTLDILNQKTKGNLTATEENLLQNCLYELRMAYVEVTNALTRPPQTAGTAPAKPARTK